MPTPLQLSVELVAARDAITEDGDLPAHVRSNLLKLFEKLSAEEHESAGYLRRARLALICAIEVHELLSAYPAVQSVVDATLAAALRALSGDWSLQDLEADNGAMHTKVIDLFQHGSSAFIAAYAGMAAFSAVNTVLYDVDFEVLGLDEFQIPPDDWDASFYASLAVSGGAVWENLGGTEQRRAYWLWYLEHAIPRAWDVLEPLKV